MRNLGLLLLRLTMGSLVAGHGAQKLFGWFEGPGWRGTATAMESMHMMPGELWGTLAGAAEFAGGSLTALGLLDPIGPVAAIGAMSMATAKAHWGKPIWAAKGGAELPVTNIAAAAAILLAGRGTLSLDALLGIKLPRWIAVPGLAIAAGTVYTGVTGELPLPKEWQDRLRQQLPVWQRQAQDLLTTAGPAATGMPSSPTATPPQTAATATDSSGDRREQERPNVASTL
jgi:putative oxidoreductase